MSDWQSIETVPLHKVVELKIPTLTFSPIVKGSTGPWGYWTIEVDGNWWCVSGYEPTHWRPLKEEE